MTPREFLELLHVAERLKDTTRHCTTSGRRVESVAEHSWRLALMAFFLKDEFPEADMDKVVKMCLIQHNESPLDTWSGNEYDLNKVYAFDAVAFSPWLTVLRKEILKDTLEKIGG